MLLPDRVLATIRAHAMVPRGGRVLVALSGGPDSVGLLHLLCELDRRGEVTVAGAAHLNHGIREAAAGDEDFCRALAASLGVPFVSERADVRGMAREWRTSLEAAGRRARYEFLRRAAAELHAVVATGHTLDDQAETFLLQLIRGAGPRGLSSIAPFDGLVCRPLLDVRRAAVRGWLVERDLPFREDESNADQAFTRNRVRHSLLPLLRREFSPGIDEVLAREASIAREDEDWLHAQATAIAPSIVLIKDGVVQLDAEALAALHPAIASRVARDALSCLSPDRAIEYGHVRALLALARTPGPSAVSLPGQQARRRGRFVILRPRAKAAVANSFRVSLSIPGEVLLEPQGWAVSATLAGPDFAGRQPDGQQDSGPPHLSVALPFDRLALPLTVRSRRPGDRLRPAGMKGRRKKLQDLFVDRKIDSDLRDAVPIVVDRDDRILWVVGAGVAEDFRVTEPLQGVLLLKARRLGGLG
jgi:tRNA(Ile)-lysidine synthase